MSLVFRKNYTAYLLEIPRPVEERIMMCETSHYSLKIDHLPPDTIIPGLWYLKDLVHHVQYHQMSIPQIEIFLSEEQDTSQNKSKIDQALKRLSADCKAFILERTQ